MSLSKWLSTKMATFQLACWKSMKMDGYYFGPHFTQHLANKMLEDTNKSFANVEVYDVDSLFLTVRPCN